MTTRKTLDGKSYAGDPHIIKPNWRFAPKTATAAALAIAAALAAAMPATASDTWYWTGLNTTPAGSGNASDWGYDASLAVNWTNLVTKSQGVPQNGDIIVFSSDYAHNSQGIGINKITSTKFGGVRYEKGQQAIKQSWLMIADGGFVTFTDAAASSDWTCVVNFVGTGTVDIASGKTLKLNWRKVSGASATLVKEGKGTFLVSNNKNSNSGTESNVGTYLLRAGTLGLHWAKGVKEFRFDSNDPAIRLQIGTRSRDSGGDGIFFANGALSEADCVDNTTHGVTSSYGLNLTFTGTPTVEDMVFTGTFYGSAGLVWNPAAANYTFSFKKATHQTTGLIAISNGVVRACDGARFPNLTRVNVDGANSRFRVETTGGFPMPSATIALSNGGKVALASGVKMTASAVTVDGAAVAAGLYHGAGAAPILGSTEASWIDGAGYVAVGLAAAAQTSATWTGAGADTLSGTAANWSGAAPTLTDGSAFVTVTGGTGFTAEDNAWLDGFDLTGVSSFAVGAAADKELWLGSGGIRGGNGTYSIDAPISVAAPQTWNFSNGATVNFNAPFVGGIDTCEVYVNGTGSVFNVNSSLGPKNFQVGFKQRNTVNIAAGVTNNADIFLYNESSSGYQDVINTLIKFKGGAPIVMNGFLHNTNISWRLNFAANADVTFNCEFLNHGSTYFSGIGANARVRFNKPFLARNSFLPNNFDSTAVIELNAEGNCLGHANPWTVTDGHGPFQSGTIRTLVPYALKDFLVPAGTFVYNGSAASEAQGGRFFMTGNAVLDLYGNDQSLQILYAAGGTVTSAADARMTLNDDSTWTSATAKKTRADYATWAGGAGLVFNGKSADWPRYMMKVSSTTGRLEVVQGRLVFPSASGDALVTSIGSESATSVARPATNAGWPNCSEATVRGGTLEIEHSNTFGKQTVVKFEETDGAYGKIKLAAGVSQRVGSLWVDGVKLPSGTYGAAGSGAAYARPDLFADGGTGILRVGASGMILCFR